MMRANTCRNHFGGQAAAAAVKVLHLTPSSASCVCKVNRSATGNEFKINRFAISYNLCCDAMDLINVSFGLQLLLFTSMCFASSLFAVFFSFRLWYKHQITNPQQQERSDAIILVFEQLFWSTYYYAVVVAIIAVASSLTNMVRQSMSHVQFILSCP